MMMKTAMSRLSVLVIVLSLLSGFISLKALARDEVAVRLFEVQMALAKSGDAAGQFHVGEMYEQGLGTDQDLQKAQTWYKKSAGQGHEPAKKKLATWDRAKKEAMKDEAAAVEEAIAAQLARDREAAKSRERAAAAAKTKAEKQTKAQQAAKSRERAAAEKSRREAAARAAKAKKAPAPVKAKGPAPKEEEGFSANPCKGPSAKFLSTCK